MRMTGVAGTDCWVRAWPASRCPRRMRHTPQFANIARLDRSGLFQYEDRPPRCYDDSLDAAFTEWLMG
jgi:hypothetical protein